MPWLPSAVWLALLVVFGLVEAATVGLVSIWFAAGSLAALLSTIFTDNIWVQIAIFLAISAAALAVVRRLARKYLTPRQVATNADRVIGREAVVTEEIDNLKGCGAVSVGGVTWTARSDSGEIIPAGETVKALRIEGVKLFVASVPTGKE